MEEAKPTVSPGAVYGGVPLPVILAASGYAFVSSTLSIANKWAMMALPYAGLLTFFQFVTSAAVVSGLGWAGQVEVEPLSMEKIRKMLPVCVIFYAAIFTNTKILQFCTVEVFIAFRSTTPLLVCGLDVLVRNQALPSRRTAAISIHV